MWDGMAWQGNSVSHRHGVISTWGGHWSYHQCLESSVGEDRVGRMKKQKAASLLVFHSSRRFSRIYISVSYASLHPIHIQWTEGELEVCNLKRVEKYNHKQCIFLNDQDTSSNYVKDFYKCTFQGSSTLFT